MLLYKKVKEDLKSKESDKQIFNVYCRSKFKKIISYKDPQNELGKLKKEGILTYDKNTFILKENFHE